MQIPVCLGVNLANTLQEFLYKLCILLAKGIFDFLQLLFCLTVDFVLYGRLCAFKLLLVLFELLFLSLLQFRNILFSLSLSLLQFLSPVCKY